MRHLFLLFIGFVVSGSIPWVTDPVSAPGVTYHVFYSEAAGEDVSYHIYLPEAYHEEPERDFPVLYWLHGGTSRAPVTAGILQLAPWFEERIEGSSVPPMIIVFPNGLPFGMWCDSKDGNQPVETILIEELIPLVDEQFRTIDKREGRLIEGFSMGGYGAARLGMKYQSRFAGFSMLGAGPLQLDFLDDGPRVPLPTRIEIFNSVFGGDMDYFEAQSPLRIAETFAEHLPPNMPIRQAIGVLDELYENNLAFHQHLAGLQIPHQYFEVPNVGHNPLPVMDNLFVNDPDFYHRVFQESPVHTDDNDKKPSGFYLFQNYPNPFNPSTKIAFSLPEPSYVKVAVYDIFGQKMDLLLNKRMGPGMHNLTWDASSYASGTYLCRVKTNEEVFVRSMTLFK